MTTRTANRAEENSVLPDGKEPAKIFTVARRCGRLGNRLILFAHLIGFAEEHGHKIINFTFHSFADFFESTRRDVYCGYPASRGKSWIDRTPGLSPLLRWSRLPFHMTRMGSWVNERTQLFGHRVVTLRELRGTKSTPLESAHVQEQIRGARLVFLQGFNFHAPEAVRAHAQKIRCYFQPVAKYEQESLATISQLRRDADIVAGIHIRQGDYARWLGGKFFFPVSRYKSWMEDIETQFPSKRVAFLVCSDEPRNIQEFAGLQVVLGSNSNMTDLCALAKCDYIAGPPSTFSKWASFYGDKPLFHFTSADAAPVIADFKVSNLM